MVNKDVSIARQVAEAARLFQKQRTGHDPRSVGVVLSEGTLVVTLRGALTPAEQAMGSTATGAAQVAEFHRQLFATSSHIMREEIKRITGIDVREAVADIATVDGTVLHGFQTGTVVQVFFLAEPLGHEAWSEPDE